MGLINNISGVQQSDSVIYINIFLGFPGGSAGKESACSERDLGSIPGLGRSPGERKGYPLQYSGLENSRDCLVQGVAKSQTQLSNFHFCALFGFLGGTAGKNPPASAETVHGITLSQTLLKQLSIHTHTHTHTHTHKASVNSARPCRSLKRSPIAHGHCRW